MPNQENWRRKKQQTGLYGQAVGWQAREHPTIPNESKERRGESTHRIDASQAQVYGRTRSPIKTRSMAAWKRGGEAPVKTTKEEEAVAPASAAEHKGRKRAKKEADALVTVEDGGAVVSDGKRVVVEACTQYRQFKIRALKVKEDLESAVPGVSVKINPEKPRRRCLEIREEGGEVFISLLNMLRPFTAMKKLGMDEVIKDIAKKIS